MLPMAKRIFRGEKVMDSAAVWVLQGGMPSIVRPVYPHVRLQILKVPLCTRLIGLGVLGSSATSVSDIVDKA